MSQSMPPANLDASLVNDPFMVENHNSSSLAAPSSYMVRTRYENRPWSGSDNGAADDIDDDIQQLDRYKATSKKTNISEQFQFQQRVAAKKAAYRAVLAGDRPSSDRKLVSDREDDDHEKNDETERLSQVLSETTGTEPSEAIILNSVTSEAARLARAKRLAAARCAAIGAITVHKIVEEFLKRRAFRHDWTRLCVGCDSRRGRDVHNRRTDLLCQICERCWSGLCCCRNALRDQQRGGQEGQPERAEPQV